MAAFVPVAGLKHLTADNVAAGPLPVLLCVSFLIPRVKFVMCFFIVTPKMSCCVEVLIHSRWVGAVGYSVLLEPRVGARVWGWGAGEIWCFV